MTCPDYPEWTAASGQDQLPVHPVRVNDIGENNATKSLRPHNCFHTIVSPTHLDWILLCPVHHQTPDIGCQISGCLAGHC